MGAEKQRDVMEALPGCHCYGGLCKPIFASSPHNVGSTQRAPFGCILGMLGNESKPLTEGHGQSQLPAVLPSPLAVARQGAGELP